MPAKRRSPTSRRRSLRSDGATRQPANFFDRLEWRCAGPYRGGRVGAVAGDPRERNTFYFGSTGGGALETLDGGVYWGNTSDRFFKTPSGGAIDLSIDPNNPRIMYASFWEAIRRPWELVSGGPGSGLFRSSDGGDTWTEISRAKGLPKGLLGKVGVSASAAKSGRVYAIVEAEDGAVFRSDDFGDSWERCSEDRNLRQRAWYYHHIYAHPTDPETVWVLNVSAWLSNDGGKTFLELSVPHGDHHDLWIDPKDPLRIINGNDGGAGVTVNRGGRWGAAPSPTARADPAPTGR